MTADSLIQLAFSIHNNPGTYALLLGSGISRAASIPTGYEVTLEMIRQLSALHGETPLELEKWYLEKFGKRPEYSVLLDDLGKTPTERHGFLRPFFEPTTQDKEENKKLPTSAHKAIAKMVASRKIRVIITTNFDRLIERAIQDEGITPTIISSGDSVDGAVPLVHSRCTVIKINGDYLDTRAKNTVDELEHYDTRLERLLDQVFDEFGLLISGWSGDWDKALRSCIERAKGRRFSCYWCFKGEPSEAAKSLISLRSATTIKIESADSFFTELEDKLESLSEINKPHPLSALLAVSSLKRYIVEDKYRIQLHDLLMNETNKVCLRLGSSDYPMTGQPVPSSETMEARIKLYNNELSILIPLFMNLCFWAKKDQEDLCVKVLQKIANSVSEGNGYKTWIALRLFPSSLLICAGGMASLLSKNYSLHEKLLKDVKVKRLNSETFAASEILPYMVLEQDTAQSFPNQKNKYTPMNNIIFDYLYPYFQELSLSEEDYKLAFDRFEYISAMIYIDISGDSKRGDYAWAPPGQFAWKRTDTSHISSVIENEIILQMSNWSPLKQGVFGGKLEQAKECKKLLDAFLPKLLWRF